MADGQVLRQFNTARIGERRENRIETLCHKSKDYLDIEAHNFCCLSVLVGHRNEVALVCWYIYKWGLWETYISEWDRQSTSGSQRLRF